MQIGSQQQPSQLLGLTPPSRRNVPRLPGQRWICNTYPRAAARAQLIHPSSGHFCHGKHRLLHSCNSTAFRPEYCHEVTDALMDRLEWRRRRVHSTSPLLQVDTAGSGPSPWDKLPRSLPLDVGPPAQTRCAYQRRYKPGSLNVHFPNPNSCAFVV